MLYEYVLVISIQDISNLVR